MADTNNEFQVQSEASQRIVCMTEDEFWPELLSDAERLAEFLDQVNNLSHRIVELLPNISDGNQFDAYVYEFFTSLHRLIGHLGFRLIPLHEPTLPTFEEAFESVTINQIFFIPDSLDDYQIALNQILDTLIFNQAFAVLELVELLETVKTRIANLNLVYPSVLNVVNDHQHIEPEKMVKHLQYYAGMQIDKSKIDPTSTKLSSDRPSSVYATSNTFQLTTSDANGTVSRTVLTNFRVPKGERVLSDTVTAADITADSYETPTEFKLTIEIPTGDIYCTRVPNVLGSLADR